MKIALRIILTTDDLFRFHIQFIQMLRLLQQSMLSQLSNSDLLPRRFTSTVYLYSFILAIQAYFYSFTSTVLLLQFYFYSFTFAATLSRFLCQSKKHIFLDLMFSTNKFNLTKHFFLDLMSLPELIHDDERANERRSYLTIEVDDLFNVL